MTHLVHPTPRAAVRLRGVRHQYPGAETPALAIDALDLVGGQLVAVAGPNGAGKTTLLNLIGSLLAPTAGTVRVDYLGRDGNLRTVDLPAFGEAFRHEAVGFAFQHHGLLAALDVLTNVALPLLIGGVPAEEARAAAARRLQEVGLPAKFWTVRPDQLSGGERQRAAVARALVTDPPVLLADEPFAAADVTGRDVILPVLRRHADAGNLVVLVAHDAELLGQWSDRVVVVEWGRLVFPFSGDPDDPAPDAAGRFGGRRRLPSRTGPDGRRSEAESHDVGVVIDGHIRKPAPPSPSPEPPRSAPLPPARQGATAPAARPSLGRRVPGVAAAEVFSRRHAAARLGVAAILAAVVAGFTFAADLVLGVVTRTRERTLGESPLMDGGLYPEAGQLGGLTPEQLAYPPRLPGVLRVSPRQTLLSLYVHRLDRRDETTGTRAESVPVGDPALEPVPPGRPATAGVHYVSGGPFTGGMADAAGVVVEEEFLRERLGAKCIPPELEFYLHREAGATPVAWELRGLDGRLPVPVVGVFRYPDAVKRQAAGGAGLPQLYLPERFLARLAAPDGWSARAGYRYPSAATGKPLLGPVDVVAAVRVRTTGGDVRAATAPAVREAAAAPFGVLPPRAEPTADGFVLRPTLLAEGGNPAHWLAKEEYARRFVRGIEDAAGGAVTVEIAAVPLTDYVPELPAFDPAALRYARAVVQFSDPDLMLPALRQATAERPDLRLRVPNPEALARLAAVRALAGWGVALMGVAFAAGLGCVVLVASFQHASSKSADTSVLRALGLPTRRIGVLRVVELTFLLFPPCVLGVAAALGAAAAADAPVARQVSRLEAEARQDGTEHAAAEIGRVFQSRQVGVEGVAGPVAVVLAAAAACVACGAALAVAATTPRQVAAGLRGGGG